MKTIFTFLSLVFALFAAVILFRAATIRPPDSPLADCTPNEKYFIALTPQRLERFRTAIKIPTVSKERDMTGKMASSIPDLPIMKKMNNFIVSSYPTIHSSPFVKYEMVAGYSFLYTITGTNPNLKPFMLLGHMDVVPTTGQPWSVDPFEAVVKDDFVYGRGTIDNKNTVFGVLEAFEELLKSGYRPQKSFYISFGHDEEVMGLDGAKNVVKLLQERKVDLDFVLDEGMMVTQGIYPNVEKEVATIATSEKGFLTLNLTVTAKPGHSSMPPRETSIGILSKAIAKLEANPQPSQFGKGPEWDTLEQLAHELPFVQRIAIANLWLFAPIVASALSLDPVTNAIVRSTTAATIIQGGFKANVLASSVSAIINHRIHPGQTIQEVLDYDKYIINDDRVKMDVLYGNEAAPVSPSGADDFGYQTIRRSILQIFPKSIVVPGLLIGGTDTKHYTPLTKNIYRFCPTKMFPGDPARFHGTDERMSKKNLEQTINFYVHILTNADQATLLESGHKKIHEDL